jgi:hypothetical protein
MKDPYQVLRQKEQDISLIRQQVEALRTVIPLLADTGDDVSGQGSDHTAFGNAEPKNWSSAKKQRDDKAVGQSD